MKRFLNWFRAAPALFRSRASWTTAPARVGKANRWLPQLEALEDRYVPSLIGGPDWSTSGQVKFNFDNQPNDVSIHASFDYFISTTYVDVLDGVGGSNSYPVYFAPWEYGGDPTIVLNMGSGNNKVTIQGNANKIIVNGAGFRDAVNVGNALHNLQDIRNPNSAPCY